MTQRNRLSVDVADATVARIEMHRDHVDVHLVLWDEASAVLGVRDSIWLEDNGSVGQTISSWRRVEQAELVEEACRRHGEDPAGYVLIEVLGAWEEEPLLRAVAADAALRLL